MTVEEKIKELAEDCCNTQCPNCHETKRALAAMLRKCIEQRDEWIPDVNGLKHIKPEMIEWSNAALLAAAKEVEK